MKHVCDWCVYEYPDFSRAAEDLHLAVCPVFTTLPVVARSDGKDFVQLPGWPEILVERPHLDC